MLGARRMIKMIVTDLDDTLLRTDKSISAYTLDTLQEVQKKGIKIVYATARGRSAKKILPYDIFDGRVLMNGALVFVGTKLVDSVLINASSYNPYLKELARLGLKVAAEIDGFSYANYDVKSRWTYIDKYYSIDFSEPGLDAEKLYIVIESARDKEVVRELLPPDLYVSFSKDGMAMVMDKGATKFQGILKIAQNFAIDKTEILTFGDDDNDKEMLKKSALGVAMANALEEVKASADAICASNDDDGVAKWLAKNIIEKN